MISMAVILCLFVASLPPPSFEDCVTALSGVSSMDQLSEEELERYSHLYDNPLDINYLSAKDLAASALFTPFQIATLSDYRAKHGDILSAMELSLIDGFCPAAAYYLAPFISFKADLPGVSGSLQNQRKTELNTRYVHRAAGDAYRLKVSSEGNKLSCGIAITEDKSEFHLPSVYLQAINSRRGRKVIAGAYNARFGQGLSAWSGFSLSTLPTASSSLSRPSGLTKSLSYTSASLHGVAAEQTFGRCILSAFLDVPRLNYALTRAGGAKGEYTLGVDYTLRTGNGQIGVTSLWGGSQWVQTGSETYLGVQQAQSVYSINGGSSLGESAISPFSRFIPRRIGVNTALCVNGMDLFCEAAFNNSELGVIAGIRYNLSYDNKLALVLRYYPDSFFPLLCGSLRSGSKVRDEQSILFCADIWKAFFTMEFLRRPSSAESGMRSRLSGKYPIGECWLIKPQLTYKGGIPFASPGKLDGRVDICKEGEGFVACLRLEGVKVEKWGALSYIESGFRRGKNLIYARVTGYVVPSWKERIYCYERDAPGAFLTGVYYGRGAAASLYASLLAAEKKRFSLRFWLRGACSAAEIGGEQKRSADLRLQMQLRL